MSVSLCVVGGEQRKLAVESKRKTKLDKATDPGMMASASRLCRGLSTEVKNSTNTK